MNNERLYPTLAEEQELLELKKRYGIRDSTAPSFEKSITPENKKSKQLIVPNNQLPQTL